MQQFSTDASILCLLSWINVEPLSWDIVCACVWVRVCVCLCVCVFVCVHAGKPQFIHMGEEVDGVDMRAEVGLLSRNILLRGEMEPGCYGNEACKFFNFDTFGGHLKVCFCPNLVIYRANNQQIQMWQDEGCWDIFHSPLAKPSLGCTSLACNHPANSTTIPPVLQAPSPDGSVRG